ncbi:hypothetical protein Tco_1262801 [Tanacetum coccineum]
MDSNLNNENDQWKLSLDIYDSDLQLTIVLTPRSSTRVETSTATQKPVRIIPGPAGDIENFLKNGKLDQVIAIVKSCSPNMIGDSDYERYLRYNTWNKVVDEGGYRKDITVGADTC